MKHIFIREDIPEHTEVAYTTLTNLLREARLGHLYQSVRNVFQKGKPFIYNNILIKKVPLKHYEKHGKQ